MWVSSTINVLLSNTETRTHTNREERIHLVSTKAICALWQRQPVQTLLFQQGTGDRPVAVTQAVVASTRISRCHTSGKNKHKVQPTFSHLVD